MPCDSLRTSGSRPPVCVEWTRFWRRRGRQSRPAILGRGCDLLREAASVGEAIGDILGAVAALHGLARLGYAQEVMARMAALAEAIEGPLAPARVGPYSCPRRTGSRRARECR